MNTLRISQRFSNFRSFSTSRIHNASLGSCGSLPDYGPMEIGRCELMNGIKVASARPFGAPMAACTIMYQSGSRFERDDQLGATHFLRTCSTASGCAYTSFSKTRVLQQLGSYITVSADRQSIAYTLRCPVPAFHDVKYYLLDIAARAQFAQHELEAMKPQLKLDLHTIHPEALVMDLVQKACWGGGLNNSVYCAKARIGSMSADAMNAFTTLEMRSDACTVGSYGLPFEELMCFAEMIEPTNRSREKEEPTLANISMPIEECALLNRKIDFKLDLPATPRCCPPSFARGGFEFHDLGPNSDTWIALAVPGCGSTDLCCLMKHSIIAAACGTGSMSRGQHSQDRTSQPPLGEFADCFTMFKAFNISYCDTGLFGILIKTRSCNAAPAAFVAAGFLKKLGDLSCEQIKIGKERLKLELSLHEEDCVNISEGMALQAASGTRLDNAYAAISLLNAIPEQDVSATARGLASKCCKMAVAAVGDVQVVPYDVELLCMC